ncbi:MAG: valine--tRNA ligase [Clostridia bacterium]|nr:valine--tRNA ligase [Clostridia bacterium]MBQ9482044.1 valine--tRNA ligase [Clostridia bacterium]
MDMPKTYSPKEFETQIYEKWEREGYFKAQPNADKIPFTVVIPPPNITGQLHMGHSLNHTLQDSIVRYKRMQGYETLWLPGTDHASIATEVKIIEQMAKEGLKKEDVGREGFLERAWAWKEKYGNRIIEQIKHLGSSCDWSRLAFTMDEKCSKAVKEVFVNLYNKGLIYQGSKIINWCPHCKTALSDAEVEYSEEPSFFWHLRYPFKDGSGYITVATTRPETMLGDTAVAVNPTDERYSHLVGKTLILPLVGSEIPVIADAYVDKEFGSGAVKITPAHDPNDFEVGLRHDLEAIRVMSDDGSMNERAGKYCGMDRYEARKAIVEDLKACGALDRIEPHAHNVGHCYRCHNAVEPIISKQWFVKMEPLAKPAIDAVRKHKVKFTPDRFSKIYFNWMENIRDWCISRQLWWGHRIPAYYCDDCGAVMVEKETPKVCSKCGGVHIRQDEDVLDTWFSSALWPFSTLGYPDSTADLDYFFPTDVLVTAYDIIFFWVARMIFSSLEHTKRIPFKDVLIHGIVRDAEGRKMSKSLGNGIDPLEIIDEYGADSLRFSLINGISAGNDTRFSKEKTEGARNFMNKIWNASRFVIMNCEGHDIPDISECKLTVADKWIISKLNTAVRNVTANMEKYEMGLACASLYDFIWSDFCDWYIELTKPVLYGADETKRRSTLGVLVYVLKNALKLLHPFVPFITEEIYRNLPDCDGSIMVSAFPKYDSKHAYRKDAANMEAVMEIIKTVRNIKAQVGAAASKKAQLFVVTETLAKVINNCRVYIEKLAGVSEITFVSGKDAVEGKIISQVLKECELYVPLGELVDTEKEIARLKAELERINGEIDRATAKLGNAGFVAKAPKALIDGEHEKLVKYREMKEKIEAQINEFIS